MFLVIRKSLNKVRKMLKFYSNSDLELLSSEGRQYLSLS